MIQRKREQRKLVKLKKVIQHPLGNKTLEISREETAADMIMRGDPSWKRVDAPKERPKPKVPVQKQVMKENEMLLDTATQEKEKDKLDLIPLSQLIKLINETEDGQTLLKLSKDERPKIRAVAIKRCEALGIEFNN